MKYTSMAQAIPEIRREPKLSAGARLIQQAGEPRLDGFITLGEVLTLLAALFLICVSGVVIGTAVGLLLSKVVDGLKFGCAGGAIVGGCAVALRAIADMWVFPKPPILSSEERPKPDHRGVDVWVQTVGTGEVKRGSILPMLPAAKATKIIGLVARDVIENGQRISKRQAGRHFGRHFSVALGQMIQAGLVVQAGSGHNAGYDLTDAGEEWLKRFL